MSLVNGFDATQEETSESYDALPAGSYTAIIRAGEERSTKAGDGEYLSLEFEVVGPTHAGRKVWTNLNLKNPNPKAVAIARKDLAAICLAVGVPRPQHHADLYDKPLQIKVAQREYQGEMKNEIKGFKAAPVANFARTSSAAPPQHQAPQQSAFSDEDPPWGR